jgi:hypothetical protein
MLYKLYNVRSTSVLLSVRKTKSKVSSAFILKTTTTNANAYRLEKRF